MLDIGAVVWGVQDVPRSVDFWSKALNYRLKYPASEGWAILVPVQIRCLLRKPEDIIWIYSQMIRKGKWKDCWL